MELTKEFQTYVEIVQRLRKECPWDREQTHTSLRNHLLEEAYETIEAIDKQDPGELRDELGDLLLHIVLHAIIAEETDSFSLLDILRRNKEKLIRRHPHVFGSKTFNTKEEVKENWEKTKMQEGRSSVTDGLPHALPALIRATRLQDKVSKVGFDWDDPSDVWKKVEEETAELTAAVESGDTDEMEHEFGDLLFALVNYGRFIHLHPEDALRRATLRFEARFRHVEKKLAEKDLRPEDVTLKEMDMFWDEAKRSEKKD
jgi:XTP/dITP diphosphohydrolase